MKRLLQLSLLVEPDRQRFIRFAVRAARALGANEFRVANRLLPTLEQLREDDLHYDGTLEVELIVEGNALFVAWPGRRNRLAGLEAEPTETELDRLAAELRMESESADPELLKRRNQKISDDLERFTRIAAEQMQDMELALDRKRQELEKSIQQAETDSLTGLLNRGAYDDRLREAMLRTQRQHEALSLLMLDLDFFKQINDTHGHQYGDEYLKKMADAMRHAVREHVDIPCRMGGDEFVIIAFCGLEHAERIAQKVLAGMDNKVSIGIAQCLSNDTIDTLVGRADAALYEAKRRGRNQYAVAREQADDEQSPATEVALNA